MSHGSRALRRTVVSLLERRPHSPARRPERRPVVLLHGFASSPRVLVPLERHLRHVLGRDVWRLSLPASGGGDLRQAARELEARIASRARAGGGADPADALDVVGHSMGGLVATWLLKRLDGGRRLRTVVTLGTPHRGAPLAALGTTLLGGLCPALAQMAPGSPLVEELKWLPVPEGAELISVWGTRDALVPERAARLTPLPGHRNVRVGDAHHASLLLSRGVFRIVGDLLQAPAAAPLPLSEAA